MKLLKSPWVMTIGLILLSVFFSAEIVDNIAKVSPDLAAKLKRKSNPDSATTTK
ncbi:hypothetical protein [Flavobacterium sp. HNIBRBA15423]|uniref:hypothetical protein n=1 Tax=Flavobacterium sp. HNIBRBA15423 TaxID=3458683 RepID=UPI004044417D